MTEIKRSIIIEAPVNKVFEYASDYLKWPEFYDGVSDFKPITQTTRGTGAKYVYKAAILGMKARVGTEITEFRKNEGWIGKSFKGFKHKTLWIFKKVNGNTELTHSLSYKMPFYMGGKFTDKKFLKPAWITIIKNSLRNLKLIMEEDKN